MIAIAGIRYTQSKGSTCRICGRAFSVRHYGDGKVTVLCDCGCLILTPKGAWSFVPSKDYKKEYAHLRAAKREAKAVIQIKEATTPKESQAAAIKRSAKARRV